MSVSRSRISNVEGSWGSGLATMEVETLQPRQDQPWPVLTVKHETLAVENAQFFRALENAFGGVIQPGHSVDLRRVIGQEIYWVGEDWNPSCLAGFIPVDLDDGDALYTWWRECGWRTEEEIVQAGINWAEQALRAFRIVPTEMIEAQFGDVMEIVREHMSELVVLEQGGNNGELHKLPVSKQGKVGNPFTSETIELFDAEEAFIEGAYAARDSYMANRTGEIH